MMIHGSFHGTRTNGIVSVVEIARSMFIASASPMRPCCMSTQSQSKPACAMTSVVCALGALSHAPIVFCPARQARSVVFGRMEEFPSR